MKFIFPKNYRYRAKILGFIDYITAIVDSLIGILLFFLIRIFTKKITTRNIYFYYFIYSNIIIFNFLFRWRKHYLLYYKHYKIYEKKRSLLLQ